MSSYCNDDITRDGFAYSYGRFYALPGRVELVEGSTLRSMFLPRLTAEGRKKLEYSDYFVRGQLKHYGVQFEEREFTGNGTNLMKKILQAGKCDKVPDHITLLREQMHREWLNKLTPEQLSSNPEWAIERYFSSGQPDRTKTTTVVGIPFPPESSYRSGQMREAASKVEGLHQETGFGPKTQIIFMGWDSVAVSKAAKAHASKEAKQLKAAEDDWENERTELHTNYLNSLKRKKRSKDPKTYSPIGGYIIDCEEIKEQYSVEADDLSLDIRQTEKPGVFEASFDFGILEGVMIISAEKNALEQHCSQLDREADTSWDEDEDEEEDRDEDEVETDVENNRKPTTGSKRKIGTSRGRGHPSKKSKADVVSPHTRAYLLKLKCRETGEGVIKFTAEKGSIKFKDQNMASFMGKADLPHVGEGVCFSARKISDTPAHATNSWADYSERAYENERVGRWH